MLSVSFPRPYITSVNYYAHVPICVFVQMEKLLERKLPKLAKHLQEHGVGPFLYASSWFLTVFSTEFPIRFACRVLDVVLAERSTRVIMQVALMLMEECEAHCLNMHDFEEIVNHIRTWLPKLPLETLHEILTAALSSRISQEELDSLEQQYYREKDTAPENDAAVNDSHKDFKLQDNKAAETTCASTVSARMASTPVTAKTADNLHHSGESSYKGDLGNFSLIDISDALPATTSAPSSSSLYPDIPLVPSNAGRPLTHTFTPAPTSLEKTTTQSASSYPQVGRTDVVLLLFF